MKNILYIIPIIIISNCFGQGSTTRGFYSFEDPIGTIIPVWYQLKKQDSLIVKESTFLNKSEYRTTLNYFDSLGFMYKSEEWIEDQKKRSAHLVRHSDYKIKFDSIQGVQVETGHNNLNYYYYDSIKFKANGTLEYRYKLEIRNLNGITWDTVSRLYVKLISHSENIRKYETKNGWGKRSINTYINDRPVCFNWIDYADTIIYKDHEDFTLVNYYFKNQDDNTYQIGEKDSLSSGLLQSKQTFERYTSANFNNENYFYDNKNRLVLKTSSHGRISIEVHDYNFNEHNRYIIESEHTIKTSYYKLKEFPFEGWKLTSSEKT